MKISNTAEAFAGVIFAAIASDERLSEEELADLHTILSRTRLFEGWSDGRHQALFDKLDTILKEQGLEALMEQSIETLPSKLHPTAFANSVDLVLADGEVTGDEKGFLYDLQQELDIEDDLAKKIIEVIIVKNRG